LVYERASFAEEGQSILVQVRPRKGSAAICPGCHQPAPGYEQSPTPWRFEFIGLWDYRVSLLNCMRRVNGRTKKGAGCRWPWIAGNAASKGTGERCPG